MPTVIAARAGRLLAVLLLVLGVSIVAAAPEPAQALTLRGQAYASITCTPSGVSWSGHVQGFAPYTAITYRWTIWRTSANGNTDVFRGQRSGFRTNGVGYHWRLPPGWPYAAMDCGPGHYSIELDVAGGNYVSRDGWDSAICT